MDSRPTGSTRAEPGPALTPIAGVTLDQYVRVSRGLVPRGYDTSQAASVAAELGIDPAHWEVAVAGWNHRITSNPCVAQEFNRRYAGSENRL